VRFEIPFLRMFLLRRPDFLLMFLGMTIPFPIPAYTCVVMRTNVPAMPRLDLLIEALAWIVVDEFVTCRSNEQVSR
jgi:hypothetical protein